jgi:hypothetical protein
MEPWRDCRPVLAGSHNFDKEQDQDPDPHQKESRIRIRIKMRRGIWIKVILVRNTCHNFAGAFVDIKVYKLFDKRKRYLLRFRFQHGRMIMS